MSSSLPLSKFQPISYLVAPLRTVVDTAASLGVNVLVIGAVARDIAYLGRGLAPPRATADVDLAVAVSGWDSYEALRRRFTRDPTMPGHRVLTDGMVVDLVPFGGVEDANHDISWPPSHDHVMSVFGFAEARANADLVDLDDALRVAVTSLPGLAALKLVAWSERHFDKASDGVDLRHLARDYGDSFHFDRLYEEETGLLETHGFDPALAGAALLGRDMAALFDAAGRQRLLDIVQPQVVEDSQLVRDMGLVDRERNLELLAAFRSGLVDAMRGR